MSKQKSTNALKNLQKAVTYCSEHESEISPSTGNEIELMTSKLIALRQRPFQLKTKDISDSEYPTGNKLPLPKGGVETAEVFERLIDQSDLLPIWFLEQGVQVQRSVARVVLTQPHELFPPGTGLATGFMISPTLFLTNNHVIRDRDFTKKIRIQFNFQLGSDGAEQSTDSFFPVVDDVFRTNQSLDYTLIRLRPNQPPNGNGDLVIPGEKWGFILLNENLIFREGQHFNIIQHPGGRLKAVALQDNEIDQLFENVVRYKTDTEPGSSGSPVFNNLWQLVALHHAGGERNENGKWLNNQGIRIDKIVEDLRIHFNSQPEILGELGI